LPRRKFSPNWHRGAFRNAVPTRRHRAVNFLRWKLTDRQALTPRRVGGGAPRVEPDRERLRDRGAPSITWLGHATTLIQLGGRTLLLDPCWGNPIGYPCRVAEQALAVDELPPIDAVLVSHNHPDHLDRRVVHRLGSEPVYAVPLGDERSLRRRGVRYIVGFDWWEWHELGHLRITFVPAHHWSQRGLTWNRSLWGGWVIQSPDATIYYSGDTARMPVLDQIGERFPAIDYALLCVGGYEPRWYMKTVHMNPAEAVDTFQAIGARTLIPVHWGTLRLGAEPPGEAPHVLGGHFSRRSLDPARLRPLAIGETLPIA